jgi:hypothetical protein
MQIEEKDPTPVQVFHVAFCLLRGNIVSEIVWFLLFFFFFSTLDTGPKRPLGLELSDTKVDEP